MKEEKAQEPTLARPTDIKSAIILVAHRDVDGEVEKGSRLDPRRCHRVDPRG